ncbi:hypothetical protein ACFR9U_15695 [Halorientalis brevis]|uniref:Uncharacterized protein n=1 Tax=Halorientalis brevis TaxID=1126241 RepID=A0ABD6CEG2_9EURY|nr:hypothetical protein [Halorientalis brevis]
MSPHTRRRFLALGAATTVGALAGCWGTTETATYADWLPATDDPMLTAYIDLTFSQKTSKIDPLLPLILPSSDDSNPPGIAPDLSALDRIDEPLLKLPLQTGGQVIGVSAISFAASGLTYLIDAAQPTQGVTELFRVNDTVVGTGDIDVTKADESLRAGGTDFLGEIRFEVVTDGDEYTLYEPKPDVSQFVAVSESSVVLSESRTNVETVIDTGQGDHDRAVEQQNTVEWLVDTAGTGDVVVGWLGPADLDGYYWRSSDADPPTAVVSQRDDVCSSVTFSPEDKRITADLALRSDTVSQSTTGRLKTQLGIAGADASLSTDGDRLSATSTYADSDLDIDFVRQTATPEETTAPERPPGSRSKPDAIPDNAFEFSYKEEKGTVRVNFVKAVEADEVTVRAVNSGSETSTTTPGVVSYLTVYLASDGDEVVVTVTVDGVSTEVARKQFA